MTNETRVALDIIGGPDRNKQILSALEEKDCQRLYNIVYEYMRTTKVNHPPPKTWVFLALCQIYVKNNQLQSSLVSEFLNYRGWRSSLKRWGSMDVQTDLLTATKNADSTIEWTAHEIGPADWPEQLILNRSTNPFNSTQQKENTMKFEHRVYINDVNADDLTDETLYQCIKNAQEKIESLLAIQESNRPKKVGKEIKKINKFIKEVSDFIDSRDE